MDLLTLTIRRPTPRAGIIVVAVATSLAALSPAHALTQPTTDPATTPSATQPADPPREDRREGQNQDEQGRDGNARDGRELNSADSGQGRGGMGRINWDSVPDPAANAESWAEITAFMREHSAFRWSIYERFEAEKRDPKLLEVSRKRIAWRYGRLQFQKERDQAYYDLYLERFRIEDGVLRRIEKLRSDGASKELDDEVNREIGKWYDSQFAERTKRLEQIRESLKREEEHLANDKGRKDELIQKQRERFETEVRMMLNPRTPPATTADSSEGATQPGR